MNIFRKIALSATFLSLGIAALTTQASAQTYTAPSSWDLTNTKVGTESTSTISTLAQGAIPSSKIGAKSGVAGLDANGNLTAPGLSQTLTTPSIVNATLTTPKLKALPTDVPGTTSLSIPSTSWVDANYAVKAANGYATLDASGNIEAAAGSGFTFNDSTSTTKTVLTQATSGYLTTASGSGIATQAITASGNVTSSGTVSGNAVTGSTVTATGNLQVGGAMMMTGKTAATILATTTPAAGTVEYASDQDVLYYYNGTSWSHPDPITAAYAALPTSGSYVKEAYYCTDCYSKLREQGDTATGIIVYWNGTAWRDSEGVAILH